jgi:two-component system, cell cycle response regulator
VTTGAGAEELDRQIATSGRLVLYFTVRYATAIMVVLALAASGVRPDVDQLAAVLTAQVVLALATHALASRGGGNVGLAVWIGMLTDVIALGVLTVMSGGVGGPLSFLFTIQALAAGILLSSKAGFRMLLLSSVTILGIDLAATQGAFGTTGSGFPRGLEAVAALWIIGGGATVFSAFNERELRRRNAELATIRQVTLDIADSLSLAEVFADLCRGVVDGFAFDAAAVLLREGETMRCVGAHGITGSTESPIDLRGRVSHALALEGPLVSTGDEARRDGTLVPLIGARGYVAVPIADDGLLIATRAGRKNRPGILRATEISALDRLSHHARLAVANARLHARVSEMAITDPLTGLANHGELQRRLAFEVGRIQRYTTLRAKGHRVSMVLCDIDHFKTFNDRFGHQAGDDVLKGVSAALRSAVRDFDVVARYGGEEFAVILPETAIDGAREVGERIRRAIAAFPFAPADGRKPVRVTVSVGIATAPENGQTAAALIKQADGALYRAKEAGRNKVFHASDAPDEVADVLSMDLTRRRREPAERPSRAGSKRVRARSALPKPRTPRA